MNIQAAYTDRFRKTLRNLKKQDQEFVENGIAEWLNNPENSSSNFEKLSFKGDNIFSIRLNKAWRVIMAKFDGMYFLLHTGADHDKTNNWAENKRIDRNITTGAIQIYNQPTEEYFNKIQALEKEEEEESMLFGGVSEEDLISLGVPNEWVDVVQEIKNEEQFMELWNHLPDDAIEHLQILLDGNVNIKVLLAQVKNETEKIPEDIKEAIAIQPGFYVIGEDESLIEKMNEDINVFRYYLHPSQHHLAYGDFSGSKKIAGSAGTGKTVVALHRAKHLAEKLEEGSKPIFFTTYTKFLIKNLESLFETQNIPESKLVVGNIDKYAFQYAKELELIPGYIKTKSSKEIWQQFVKKNPEVKYEASFLRKEYKEVIHRFHITTLEEYLAIARTGRGKQLGANDRRALWDIFKNYESYQKYSILYSYDDIIFQLIKYIELWPEYRPFSHIVCDEVQDFDNLRLRLLRTLCEKRRNDLFLAGDPFQNIYERNIIFNKSGIDMRGRSTRLKINYRTTEEIRSTASNMLNDLDFKDFTGQSSSNKGDVSILNGNSPTYHSFVNRNEELDYLAQYIKESFGTLALHEICITARSKKQTEEILEHLKNAKLPVKLLSDLTDLTELDNHIGISTMHGLKGLEFKNIIVTGCSKDKFPYKRPGFDKWSEEKKASYIKAEHALYYVAFTRAISNLVITGVGEKIEKISIN